ncbi:14096_t:CDS:2, partial [Acaulospora colombiana]
MESPIPRRLSTSISIPGSRMHEIENVINSYEAEEERIVNVLSRKLEQLRDEKIQLENILEAESESHVNQLTRELTALKQAQATGHVNGAYDSDSQNQSISSSPIQHFHPNPHEFRHPSAEVMLNALIEENRLLRARLVDTERDFIRIARLNDVYREEIIDLKRK